jgi:hypothetical protein
VGFFPKRVFPRKSLCNGCMFMCYFFSTIVCLEFLHILLSLIRVGSIFHTFSSFHLVSEPDHLKILGVRDKNFYLILV